MQSLIAPCSLWLTAHRFLNKRRCFLDDNLIQEDSNKQSIAESMRIQLNGTRNSSEEEVARMLCRNQAEIYQLIPGQGSACRKWGCRIVNRLIKQASRLSNTSIFMNMQYFKNEKEGRFLFFHPQLVVEFITITVDNRKFTSTDVCRPSDPHTPLQMKDFAKQGYEAATKQEILTAAQDTNFSVGNAYARILDIMKVEAKPMHEILEHQDHD